MIIDNQNGTTVLHRTNVEQPRRNFWTIMIGRPLATADVSHETIGKLIRLADFGSNVLSFTAFTTQEILRILTDNYMTVTASISSGVSQIISPKRWTNVLHTYTAQALRQALVFYNHVVVTNLPYLVNEAEKRTV